MAGNKARARGIECQCDESWWTTFSALFARGSNRLSVEDLSEDADSEKVELRLFLSGWFSMKVAARLKGRFRRGERLERPVAFAKSDN